MPEPAAELLVTHSLQHRHHVVVAEAWDPDQGGCLTCLRREIALFGVSGPRTLATPP